MHDDQESDAFLTSEEESIVSAYSADDITRIDDLILNTCTESFRKVAYVAGRILELAPHTPLGFLIQRIAALIEEKRLESQGNIYTIRFSEIRIPTDPYSQSYLDNLIQEEKYFNLGCLYSSGQGVEKDYSIALKWHLFGADRGNVWCQMSVGRFYEHGYGVEKNYEEAFFWYSLSAHLSEPDQMPFASLRDELDPKLTDGQKQNIQKRLDEWKIVT